MKKWLPTLDFGLYPYNVSESECFQMSYRTSAKGCRTSAKGCRTSAKGCKQTRKHYKVQIHTVSTVELPSDQRQTLLSGVQTQRHQYSGGQYIHMQATCARKTTHTMNTRHGN